LYHVLGRTQTNSKEIENYQADGGFLATRSS